MVNPIFFDYDGVLFKHEFNTETLLRAHLLALNQLRSKGIHLGIAELNKAYREVISQYINKREQKEWALKEILSKVFKEKINNGLLDRLEEIYKLNDADAEPYPATKKVITKLAKTHELDIISNCPHDSLLYELRKHNLLDYFKTITLSCDVGYRKPDPRIYLQALKEAGAKPEQSLFVYHDEIEGEGARKVGMQTALIEGENLEKLLGVIGEHG